MEALEKENQDLRRKINELEEELARAAPKTRPLDVALPFVLHASGEAITKLPALKPARLTKDQISRYSRHLLVEEFGLEGQERLCASSVLIVGAGGLGSPASIYLAGAGVGRLGVVDYDVVERSNLHRQVIHSQESVGEPKCVSACRALARLNSSVELHAYNVAFSRHNALQIVDSYDLVIDASDNVATRYLLNDACVLAGKPLVSGSAVRGEGQITVYNYRGGPCYRCMFPKPPPPETVTRCADGGVLGPVPGLVGCIQALEAMKVLADIPGTLAQRLLLIDAVEGRYNVMKLRARDPKCPVCGDNPTLRELIDYEQFCGSPATDQEAPGPQDYGVPSSHSVSAEAYHSLRLNETPHVLLDVRPRLHYKICSIPGSENIPLSELPARLGELRQRGLPLYVVCRRGNDSQLAVLQLLQHGVAQAANVHGGLRAWAQAVDPSFPIY